MAKTKHKVYDAADSVKPYVERAMTDDKLRADVISAVTTARALYSELIGGRNAAAVASRVASDEEVRERLREAVDDLRSAANRLQGKKKSHSGRTTTLLLAGMIVGLLFNPVTGPETRRFLKDMLGGGSDEFGGDYSANGGS